MTHKRLNELTGKARADQDNKWLALLDCYYRNEVALGWLGRRAYPRQAFLNDLVQCKVEDGSWVCNLPGMVGECTAEKNDAEMRSHYERQAKVIEAAKAEYERRKAEVRAGLLTRKPGEIFSAYHLCDKDESYWSLGKAVHVYLELAAEGLCTQKGEEVLFQVPVDPFIPTESELERVLADMRATRPPYHGLRPADLLNTSPRKAVKIMKALESRGLAKQVFPPGASRDVNFYEPVEINQVTIPVAHTAADFINDSAQSHRGWWATIDKPAGKAGDRVEFRDTMSDLILDSGQIMTILPPGAPALVGFGTTWARFDTWWRIVYFSDGLKEKVTVTAMPTGGEH